MPVNTAANLTFNSVASFTPLNYTFYYNIHWLQYCQILINDPYALCILLPISPEINHIILMHSTVQNYVTLNIQLEQTNPNHMANPTICGVNGK